MMDANLVGTAVTGISAVAVGLAGGSWITGRATARKTTSEARGIEAKLPAEIDSVVVAGAEAAVLTMDKALQSATKRIEQLERERESDRRRMTELESQLEALRAKVQVAEQAAGEARKVSDELTTKLSTLMREQDKRK